MKSLLKLSLLLMGLNTIYIQSTYGDEISNKQILKKAFANIIPGNYSPLSSNNSNYCGKGINLNYDQDDFSIEIRKNLNLDNTSTATESLRSSVVTLPILSELSWTKTQIENQFEAIRSETGAKYTITLDGGNTVLVQSVILEKEEKDDVRHSKNLPSNVDIKSRNEYSFTANKIEIKNILEFSNGTKQIDTCAYSLDNSVASKEKKSSPKNKREQASVKPAVK